MQTANCQTVNPYSHFTFILPFLHNAEKVGISLEKPRKRELHRKNIQTAHVMFANGTRDICKRHTWRWPMPRVVFLHGSIIFQYTVFIFQLFLRTFAADIFSNYKS